MNQAHDQASELYNSAGVEFCEDVDDHRLNMIGVKQDLVAGFSRECDEMLVELEERMAGMRERVEEEVEEHAEMVAGELCARCRCKCLRGVKDKPSELEQGRRATSLPL
jgi:predicted RecB family endonuclease